MPRGGLGVKAGWSEEQRRIRDEWGKVREARITEAEASEWPLEACLCGGHAEVAGRPFFNFPGLLKLQDAFDPWLVYLIPNGILGAGLILHEWTFNYTSLRDSVAYINIKFMWAQYFTKLLLYPCHTFNFFFQYFPLKIARYLESLFITIHPSQRISICLTGRALEQVSWILKFCFQLSHLVSSQSCVTNLSKPVSSFNKWV